MKKILPIISGLALFILCSFPGCGVLPTPKEVLPAATQTGANTFGCLVNGNVWLPKGYNGTSNLSPSYDPNFNGKIVFDISTYRILSDNDKQYLGIGIVGLDTVGTYAVNDTIGFARFSKDLCSYMYYDHTVYRKGSIKITKLSLPIVSGTFDFILFVKGCDTLKATQGRFDMTL
jgi:hypothetical protein